MSSEASSFVFETITRERSARVALLDTIDARAGVLLGFGVALTALAPQDVDFLVEIGRAALTELIAKKITRLRIGMVLIASASVSIAVGLALD